MHKMRSKLVKRLGQWWFQEMPDSEWNTKREGIVVKKESIHTEKELTEFLVQEENIRDPIDTVQYKLILIPDYSED